MVQLVQGGFGVATLPRKAVERLQTFPNLRPLVCDTPLQPLPIHASYRTDPSTDVVETVVRSAMAFAAAQPAVKSGARSAPASNISPRFEASKKSMKR